MFVFVGLLGCRSHLLMWGNKPGSRWNRGLSEKIEMGARQFMGSLPLGTSFLRSLPFPYPFLSQQIPMYTVVFANDTIASVRVDMRVDMANNIEIQYEMSIDELNEFVDERKNELLDMIRAVGNPDGIDINYEAFEKLWHYAIDNDLHHIDYICEQIDDEYDCYRFGYKRSKPHTRPETSDEFDAIQLWINDMIGIVERKQTFDFEQLNTYRSDDDHKAALQWYRQMLSMV
jgi:hypothetical protein